MQPDEMFDMTGIEDPAPFARVRKQQVVEKVIEPSLEPLSQWNSETVLGPIDDCVGKDAAHGLLENIFGGALL